MPAVNIFAMLFNGIFSHWQIRTIDRGVEVPHEGAFCGELFMYVLICTCIGYITRCRSLRDLYTEAAV